jgi:ATP-binding cassette, subfamily F, member 3
MLRIENLTLARGARQLFADANATLFPGNKVGLVGANGAGKSSLFAAITHELLPERGDISVPSEWLVGEVEQEIDATDEAALNFVLAGDDEWCKLKQILDEPSVHDAHTLGEAQARFEEINGYAAPSRAAELLAGLGFSTAQQAASVSNLSGGWRVRLALARALMQRSQLLLLDEPTNHLDLDAVMWLEEWLRRYPGALLIITHDRDFLDAVCDHIWHLHQSTITSYRGNYSTFEVTRAERLALQQAQFNQQQRQIAHIQSYIDRFRAKATKAKQAQSRIKTLERMKLIANAHVDSPFQFQFRPPQHEPKQLFSLDKVNVGYQTSDGDKTILQGVEWSCWWGERIGLLGANGAGKSTLLKTIAGALPSLGGKLHFAQHLKLGYFTQHQIDSLRMDQSPLWHLQQLAPDEKEQSHRDFLGGFDFRGDRVTTAVEPFSGGEKARLALALIVYQRPNLLLLDEPTNHLDIDMREALAEALQDYEGALIVIAHDRHLLRATTDKLMLVSDGALKEMDGDLDDYRDWVLSRSKQAVAQTSENASLDSVDRKAERRNQAEARQRLAEQRKPIEKRIAQIEKKMTPLQADKAALDAWLASEAAYTPSEKTKLAQSVKRQGEVTQLLEALEEEWLIAQEALEAVVTQGN